VIHRRTKFAKCALKFGQNGVLKTSFAGCVQISGQCFASPMVIVVQCGPLITKSTAAPGRIEVVFLLVGEDSFAG
ncbi:MAG: hypothetical protein KDA77_23280, partial [Planctomycetaceae bacterium]|nr:hypothetical protein [Planctomycetaceae bacterium]